MTLRRLPNRLTPYDRVIDTPAGQITETELQALIHANEQRAAAQARADSLYLDLETGITHQHPREGASMSIGIANSEVRVVDTRKPARTIEQVLTEKINFAEGQAEHFKALLSKVRTRPATDLSLDEIHELTNRL